MSLEEARSPVTSELIPPGPPARILAISSGGGHWVQLLRLRPAFEGHHVTFATVNRSYRDDVGDHSFQVIPDATRWSKLGMLRTAFRVLWLGMTLRPDIVISTGAAPGYLALLFARRLGARTVWLDSIANVDELSLSGQKAGRHADLWLTQWPHLASPGGPEFLGAVI